MHINYKKYSYNKEQDVEQKIKITVLHLNIFIVWKYILKDPPCNFNFSWYVCN